MPWKRSRIERSTGRKTWRVEWREGGKIRTKPLGDVTEAEAARVVERMREALNPASVVGAPHAAWEAFLRHQREEHAAGTVRWYEQILGPLMKAWADLPPRQWTRKRFEAWMRKEGKGWGPRSKGMRIQQARTFIRWCVGSGVAVPDFAAGVKAPRQQVEEADHLEPDELDAILSAAETWGRPAGRLETAVALCALASCRPSEMASATWQDVRWRKPASIRIRGTKTYHDRRNALGPRVLEILKRHRAKSGPIASLSVSRSTNAKALHALCRAAELREIRWYTLRHTFATEAVRHGVDEPTLQRLMGHQHGSTVTRRYVHTDPARLVAAVEWA